jgi:hypothetical protein
MLEICPSNAEIIGSIYCINIIEIKFCFPHYVAVWVHNHIEILELGIACSLVGLGVPIANRHQFQQSSAIRLQPNSSTLESCVEFQRRSISTVRSRRDHIQRS